jgi:hypothetical protein
MKRLHWLSALLFVLASGYAFGAFDDLVPFDQVGADARYVNVSGDTMSGALTWPSGSPPFVLNSTTVSTNLNADLLDGAHGSAFMRKDGTTMTGMLGMGSAQRIQSAVGPITIGNAATTPTSGYGDAGDCQFSGDVEAKGNFWANYIRSSSSLTAATNLNLNYASGVSGDTQGLILYDIANATSYTRIAPKFDSGIMISLNPLNNASNNNLIITTAANSSLDHGHNTPSANPTQFWHSNATAAGNLTRWGSLSHTGTGATGQAGQFQIRAGSGPVVVGEFTPRDGNSDVGDFAVAQDIEAGYTINADGGFRVGASAGLTTSVTCDGTTLLFSGGILVSTTP